MKIKYLEKANSTLTFNWKEENLLKKKLSLLESLKKHEARTWLVEQKALYSQYCKKLWRSELAYARLLGNKDLIRQLTQNEFSSSHSMMMAEYEPALMAIVQNRRDMRKTPVPGYCGSTRHDFSPAKNSNLVKEKESKKDLNGFLEASKRKLNPDPKQNRVKVNLGRRNLSVHQEGDSLDKQVQFYLQRFHNGKEQEGQKKKSISANYRSYFNQKLPSSPNKQHPATTNAGQDVRVDDQDPTSGRPNDKFLGCLHYSKSRESSYLAKSRPRSKRVFWGEEEATSFMPLRAEIQSMMSQKPHFKEKIKHYLQKVAIPPLCAPLPGDHYAKGEQERGEQDPCYSWDSEADIQKEWRKWLPVGPESSSQSVTLKKLDWCFVQKATSPEVLFLESYNAILTKENQVKRNWFHNNPYCSITKLT